MQIERPAVGKSTIPPNIYQELDLSGTLKIGFIGAAKLLGNMKDLYGLDKGCGHGRSTKFLHLLGAKTEGVDIDQDMVDIARKLLPKLSFNVSTYDHIPFDNELFDFAFSAFSHVENDPTQDHIIKSDKEVCRVLKPGKPYVIITSNTPMWGHEYISFKSSFPPSFSGRSGDRINVTFKGKAGVTFQDYYWKEEDYRRVLTEAGFHNFETVKPPPINDLCDIPPAMVIKAFKK